MTARTYAGALSDLTVAMIEVHERTCEIEPQHRWETCTSTPGIYATADALDLLAQEAGDLPASMATEVAVVLHARECADPGCGWPDEARMAQHSEAWRDQAAALLVYVSFQRDHLADAPPVPDARRGDLLARCACGHIRRGHSVDGSRCYHTPCTCQVDGGFRPQVTGP